MRERPDGAALLDTARQALLDELLAALPAEKHYTARMIAGAMAIAVREARADRPAEAALLAELGGTGGEADGDDGALLRLCHAIRKGARDPGTGAHLATRAWLERYVRLRLLISNPRALS